MTTVRATSNKKKQAVTKQLGFETQKTITELADDRAEKAMKLADGRAEKAMKTLDKRLKSLEERQEGGGKSRNCRSRSNDEDNASDGARRGIRTNIAEPDKPQTGHIPTRTLSLSYAVGSAVVCACLMLYAFWPYISFKIMGYGATFIVFQCVFLHKNDAMFTPVCTHYTLPLIKVALMWLYVFNAEPYASQWMKDHYEQTANYFYFPVGCMLFLWNVTYVCEFCSKNTIEGGDDPDELSNNHNETHAEKYIIFGYAIPATIRCKAIKIAFYRQILMYMVVAMAATCYLRYDSNVEVQRQIQANAVDVHEKNRGSANVTLAFEASKNTRLFRLWGCHHPWYKYYREGIEKPHYLCFKSLTLICEEGSNTDVTTWEGLRRCKAWSISPQSDLDMQYPTRAIIERDLQNMMVKTKNEYVMADETHTTESGKLEESVAEDLKRTTVQKMKHVFSCIVAGILTCMSAVDSQCTARQQVSMPTLLCLSLPVSAALYLHMFPFMAGTFPFSYLSTTSTHLIQKMLFYMSFGALVLISIFEDDKLLEKCERINKAVNGVRQNTNKTTNAVKSTLGLIKGLYTEVKEWLPFFQTFVFIIIIIQINSSVEHTKAYLTKGLPSDLADIPTKATAATAAGFGFLKNTCARSACSIPGIKNVLHPELMKGCP